MATVMADALDDAIKQQCIDPALIPAGVFKDAQEFFRLALSDRGPGHEARTPARMDAYAIAVDAVWSSASSNYTSLEIQERLERFNGFLERLLSGGALLSAEKELASQLRQFFRNLSLAGDAEAYIDNGQFEGSGIAIVL
ncbi:MAG TPA: hypothetical protein VF179_15420 [Thermoanaerobaculia bacterium]|nr:hypothetical protein [Thermoanaerobaculia bacterium]